MADQGDVAEQGNLEDVRLLLTNHNPADDYGPTVAHQHFCFRRLCVESGDAIDQRNTGIDLCVFDDHIHKNVAIRRDLRRYLEPQNRVHVLN